MKCAYYLRQKGYGNTPCPFVGLLLCKMLPVDLDEIFREGYVWWSNL